MQLLLHTRQQRREVGSLPWAFLIDALWPLKMSGESVTARSPTPKIEAVIGPWALPNEEVPVLFQWSPEEAIESVSLKLPPGFEVNQALNAKQSPKSVSVSWMGKPDSPGFMGFYLTNRTSPESVVTTSPCEVTFDLRGGGHVSKEVRLNTVRPRLELLSAPKTVRLQSPKNDQPNLSPAATIRLLHTGLGFVQIQVKCTVRGQVVSRSEDVLRGLVKSIADLQRQAAAPPRSAVDSDTASAMKAAGLEVAVEPMSEGELERVHNDLEEFLRSGAVPEELSSPEALEDVREFLSSVDSKILSDLVRDQVFNLYSRQLLEGIKRFPSDFSEIAGGPTRAIIQSRANEMKITLTYSDSRRNTYPPIELTLPIQDERTDPGVAVIPVMLRVENRLIREVPEISWTP